MAQPITSSIREFGFINPIIIDDDDDGEVVAGHATGETFDAVHARRNAEMDRMAAEALA